MHERAVVVISDADEKQFKHPIARGGQLFEYLNLFSRVYSRYANAVFANELQMAVGETAVAAGERAVNSVYTTVKELEQVEYGFVQYGVDENAIPNELLIESIRKNSPMEIVLLGIPIALTAAVIFSGGKVSINKESGMKFELPPVGEGLKKIREALSKDETKKIENSRGRES